MSSMCGTVDFEKKSLDFRVLREMGRAQILRGQDQSGAYLRGGIGLYHNRMLLGESEQARQPYTLTRNGNLYTVMTDGVLRGSIGHDGRFSLLDFSSAAEAILDAYFNFGLDFAPYVQGSFAFAICDEYRGEMILGRSADGKCPLYYSYKEGKLVFASEIKGMLRGLGGTLWVRGDALRQHLLSPVGTVTASVLYEAIEEIPQGHCTVFSRIDQSTFPLPHETGEESAEVGELAVPEAVLPSEDILEHALTAFDYPQFDAEMPSYLHALAKERQKNARTVRILDGTRRENLQYAKVREDRLGGLFGLWVQGMTPPEARRAQKTLRDADRWLEERMAVCDSRWMMRLYGDDVLEQVKREKSVEKRIRMRGMLCQTEAYLARYPVLTVRMAGV